MIYLNPPFFLIDGVVVAGDFADPSQFWYFPNAPHLARDEQGRPVIRFLAFKEDLDDIEGEDDVAGFLIFDTAIDWRQEVVDGVAKKLRDQLDLPAVPRLAPLLYRSGKVRLVFLDRKSPEPGEQPPEGEEPSQDWVTFIDAPAMPSLYGDNRAMFSVTLTKKAAKLLYASFDGFIPAGVVYELVYVGMQRAFNVHVEADWSLAYRFIQESEKTRVLFFSSEVDRIRQELEDKKIIKITGTLEAVGEEAMEGEFNEVRKQLNQFVFEKFFQPVPDPQKLLDKGVGGGILDFLEGLRKAGHLVDIGSTRRELTDDELKTLSIDYTVNKAVERTVAPQGHLSLFWEDFPGLERSDVVTVVQGDDELWREVEIGVLSIADFAADAVDKIVVDVAYGEFDGDEPSPDAKRFPFVLDSKTTQATRKGWFDPAFGTTFHYRYRIEFGPDAVVGDTVELVSPWLEGAASAPVTINAGTLYHELKPTFQRSRLLPTEFQEVLAHLRVRDPESGWTHTTSHLLSDQTSWTPAVRVRRDTPLTAEHRADYVRANGPIETDWAPVEGDLVLLDDPRPNLFVVRVIVAGDRQKFGRALVDFRYEDADGSVQTDFVRITAETIDDDHRFVFSRRDPARTRYEYSQTLIDAAGEASFTGWVQEDRSTLLVGDVFAQAWQVKPEVAGPTFSATGVERILLDLHYDFGDGEVADKQILFTQPGAGEPWELELRDPSRRTYSYTARYRLTSGFERKLGPRASSDTFLILSSVPPAS